MPPTQTEPLGYLAAKHAVEAGRAAFFDTETFDLPKRRSQDDLVPQFGFVGSQYPACRVLLLGINPGNDKNEEPSAKDKVLISASRSFAEHPTLESFLKAQSAYRATCQSWSVW
jgi:hypothetical protein